MKAMLAVALIGLAGAPAQDKPKGKGGAGGPKVDQKKVDEAIQKGCKYLVSCGAGFGQFGHGHRHKKYPAPVHGYGELILLTLADSGFYDDESPELQALIQNVLEKKIGSTYIASLMAMALEKLNPKKYQKRIAQCAQFLVDQQCQNGQWDYGWPVDNPLSTEPEETPALVRKDVATFSQTPASLDRARDKPGTTTRKPGIKKKPGSTKTKPGLNKIPVRKRKKGPPSGDNSNSQYAALGIRACLDSGILVESRVLKLARTFWLRNQNTDGGWGYGGHGNKGGAGGNPNGVSGSSYGSMTVGAVGALCIFDHYLKINFKSDKGVLRGMGWLAKNYTVTQNPRKTNFATYYYLYGLERLGLLFGTEKIGRHWWYAEGADVLLKAQTGFGMWQPPDRTPEQPHVNSCFAILFLRRGTVPLGKERKSVASGSARHPGKPIANAGRAGAPLAQVNGGTAFAVNRIAPGWTLSGNTVPPGFEGLGTVRGKSGVLTTFPKDGSTPAALRTLTKLTPGRQTFLDLTVGHHESGKWTLVVRVNGREVFEKEVSAKTSTAGWLELKVDLTRHAAPDEVLLEVLNKPGGGGFEAGYWARVDLRRE